MDLIKEIKASAEEVLSVLGEGYKENVYEEALAHELRIRDIPFYNNLKHSISQCFLNFVTS